eukprot:scaffold100993_cov19-Tisochrysis_lutea.AAC.1
MEAWHHLDANLLILVNAHPKRLWVCWVTGRKAGGRNLCPLYSLSELGFALLVICIPACIDPSSPHNSIADEQ